MCCAPRLFRALSICSTRPPTWQIHGTQQVHRDIVSKRRSYFASHRQVLCAELAGVFKGRLRTDRDPQKNVSAAAAQFSSRKNCTEADSLAVFILLACPPPPSSVSVGVLHLLPHRVQLRSRKNVTVFWSTSPHTNKHPEERRCF